MPVSHLGLTVSHIPSATSFYLSALQPLGYRYIGHQGDSIGLGVDSADFFLTQQPNGGRASPTHIAFSAENRLVVRECYTAALNAGGRPNGSPSYRNDDCTCFNAAVEDLDGNTIEFIYRQPHESSERGVDALSEQGRDHHRHRHHRDDGRSNTVDDDDDDARTIDRSKASRASTALEVASAASHSDRSLRKAETPTQLEDTTRKGSVPNTLIGTVLGAAAGAAIVYAMCKTEEKNAKDEIEYVQSKRSQKSRQSTDEKPVPVPTVETVPASKSEKISGKSHRNFSTTESTFVSRRPSHYRDVRAIEAAAHDQDSIQDAFTHYTISRPEPARRQTYDAIEYNPVPKSSATSHYSMARAATLPANVDVSNYYIEAPRSTTSSHHSRRSRRKSLSDNDDVAKLRHHDSGISMHSSRSSRSHRERTSDSDRRSSASTVKPARRGSVPYVSSAASRPKSESTSRTVRRAADAYYDSAVAVPLPPSVASSAYPEASHMQRRASSQYESAIEIPMPLSAATSYVSAAQIPMPASATASYVSAAQIPMPASTAASYVSAADRDATWVDADEESDGLGDMKTVVPDDSISCVDFSSRSRHSGRSSKSGRSSGSRSHHNSSRRSDTSERTVRPAKSGGSRHSAMTLPVRSKREEKKERREDGKRSAASYS